MASVNYDAKGKPHGSHLENAMLAFQRTHDPAPRRRTHEKRVPKGFHLVGKRR
jgi:hypothetical protein